MKSENKKVEKELKELLPNFNNKKFFMDGFDKYCKIQNAFMNENLEGINENIFDYEYILKDYDEQYKLYTNPNGCYRYSDLIGKKVYIMNNSYLNQCYIRFYASYDFDNMMDYEKKNIIRELTKEEIQEILEVYKKQKENFMKRLNTYLKKYGLSKLHTWTYLVD